MDFEDFEDDSKADPMQKLLGELLDGMRHYLADQIDGGGEAGYTSADIGECGRILDAYLATVEEAARGDSETVMGAVEFTVRSLNRLNERTQQHLIETDQREQICEIVRRAAASRGVGFGEDLTEPWREF
jgi:hypothetical protein